MHTVTGIVGNEILVNQYIFVRVLSKVLSWFRRASGPDLGGTHCSRNLGNCFNDLLLLLLLLLLLVILLLPYKHNYKDLTLKSVSTFMEIECKYAFLSTTKTKLTPSSRVHLEKAKVLQLVKKFPAVYGNRRIIIVFKRGRQLFLSWKRLIN
jgi:hypothetical protein